MWGYGRQTIIAPLLFFIKYSSASEKRMSRLPTIQRLLWAKISLRGRWVFFDRATAYLLLFFSSLTFPLSIFLGND